MPKNPIESFIFQDDGTFPNNPLPLLVLKQAFDVALKINPSEIENVFHSNNWGNSWRNGLYPFHHYHSTAHEVLAVACGTARVQFGGENGPVIDVQPGDVVVIPAGVGHKNLGSSFDLLVVGAYPPGPSWDLCRGTPEERPWALENIARVPLPAADPIFGMQGPLRTHWPS